MDSPAFRVQAFGSASQSLFLSHVSVHFPLGAVSYVIIRANYRAIVAVRDVAVSLSLFFVRTNACRRRSATVNERPTTAGERHARRKCSTVCTRVIRKRGRHVLPSVFLEK